VEFGSPSEFSGVHRPTALAVCPEGSRPFGSGPPLLGFFAPTTLSFRVPRSAATGVTDRGRRGLPHPRRCRPRAFSAPRRIQPRRPARTRLPGPARDVACPGTARPCSMPQTSLGFSLQSLPLSRSRAAFRRPSASLRVRLRPFIRREETESFATAFRRAPPPCRAPGPPEGSCETRRRERDATSPRSLRPPVLRASRPARRPRRPFGSFGLAGSRPFRPLRSLAPPESPFTRRSCENPDLRPSPRATVGPLLSWDSALLELSPPRPRVRSTASPPGEPGVPGRPRPLR